MSSHIWMPVCGYHGYYEVSDLGLVKSLDRTVNLKGGRVRKVKGKVLSPKRNPEGYLFVSLSKDGVIKNKYIHRLVAGGFIPNPCALAEVNHLSGDKADNAISNLQWVTHRENVQHAYEMGFSNNAGGTHRLAVGVIDNLLGQRFSTVKEWAAARGIPYSTGRNLMSGSNKSKIIDLTQVVKIIKTNA